MLEESQYTPSEKRARRRDRFDAHMEDAESILGAHAGGFITFVEVSARALDSVECAMQSAPDGAAWIAAWQQYVRLSHDIHSSREGADV